MPTPIKIEQQKQHEREVLAGGMLCGDMVCRKRIRPSTEQLSAAVDATLERRTETTWHTYVRERLSEQEARMDRIDAKLDANSEATERVALSTAGIVDMMSSWAGAMKTIEATGKVLKPMTWIVGFFTALAGLWVTLRSNWRN